MSRFSLSVRLTLFFSLIVLLLTATLSSIVFYQFDEKNNLQIRRNLISLADYKASEINNILLSERLNLLSARAFSVMSDITVNDLDKRINSELKNLKQHYQLKGDLYVFNASGILISSTQQGVLKTKLPESWQTKNDSQFIFKHDVPFINGSIVAQVAALKLPQLKMPGYLVITHPWDDISKLLEPKTENNFALRKNSENNAELFTSQGVQEIELNEDFTTQLTWFFNQENYLGAVSKTVTINDFNFQIAAFMPKKLAQESLFELINNLLVVALAVGALMIFVINLFSRHLVAPIKNLTATIRRIENSHDLSIQFLVSGRDEVADLGNAFNRMTFQLNDFFHRNAIVEQELENINANLENQILERNTQLQEALQKLKSMQTQLVQSEKMVSLGQLVIEITPEINRFLETICKSTSLLLDHIAIIQEAVATAQNDLNEADTKKFNKHLEKIDYADIVNESEKWIGNQSQATACLQNIVLSLQNFSHLNQSQVKSVLLEDGIDSALQMLQHQYKNRIVIEKDFALNEKIECYAGELNQVFMNILANAIQAISKTGSIIITTAKLNGNAIITIADTGSGMSKAVKEKVFTPFFTTKTTRDNTGLGLSIAYEIIEKHNGTLTVESELNQGTRFIIAIPLKIS